MNIDLWLTVTIWIIIFLIFVEVAGTIRSTRIYTVRTPKSNSAHYIYRFMMTRDYFTPGTKNQSLRSKRIWFGSLILISCAVHYALLCAQVYNQPVDGMSKEWLKAAFIGYLFSRQLLANQVDAYIYELLENPDIEWARLSSGSKTQYVTTVSKFPEVVQHPILLTAALTMALTAIIIAL